MVVIIVPAFTESKECQEPVVFAGVRRFVTDGAEEVGERIDGEGVVPEQNGAQAEAPRGRAGGRRSDRGLTPRIVGGMK